MLQITLNFQLLSLTLLITSNFSLFSIHFKHWEMLLSLSIKTYNIKIFNKISSELSQFRILDLFGGIEIYKKHLGHLLSRFLVELCKFSYFSFNLL